MDTNCDETSTSQKINQWKRNNLIITSCKIVGRHYSCTVCSDNQQNLRSRYLIGLFVPMHLLRLLAKYSLLCQPSPDIERFIAIAKQFLPILGVINALSSPLEKYCMGCISRGMYAPLVLTFMRQLTDK